MRRLSPFRINTSKKSRHSRIAFITKDFKFTGINTSEKNGSKSSGINTSKKQGRGEGCTHGDLYLYFNYAESRSTTLAGPRPALRP